MSNMSHLLDSRRQADLARDPHHAAPVVQVEQRGVTADKPATRADHIIATGEARRVSYRLLNPTADTAMQYGAQVGYLHGEIRRLDNELQGFTVQRNTALLYETVWCEELAADVVAGFCLDENGDIEVQELWVSGADIAAIVMERVIEQVGDAAMAKHSAWLGSL